MEWIVVKTFLSLAAVIALMFGIVFVMRKYLAGGRASSSAIVDMRIIGTMALQPKRSVSVLKVMNKVLIVGMTEEGMQALGEINDGESIRAINEALTAQPAPRRWFEKKSKSADAPSFAQAFTMQLRKAVAKDS